MAFDDDVPQLQLGPLHWALAVVLLVFLGLVITNQLQRLGEKARRGSCLDRQKKIEDAVRVWETTHANIPLKTHGYATFTLKTGRVLKTEGLPAAFKGDALSGTRAIRVFCCPEELHRNYGNDPEKVPDDGGPGGLGGYAFVQDDFKGTPPLSEFVGSVPPFRLAFCLVWADKRKPGPDGRIGSRHSEHW